MEAGRDLAPPPLTVAGCHECFVAVKSPGAHTSITLNLASNYVIKLTFGGAGGASLPSSRWLLVIPAFLYAQTGTPDLADRREAIALERGRPAPDQQRIAVLLSEMGLLYRKAGRFADAESAYTEAIALHKQPLQIATTLVNIAELYRLENRLDEAETRVRQALAIQEQDGASSAAQQAETRNNLGAILAAKHEYGAAIHEYESARAIGDRQDLAGRPVWGAVWHNLGVAYFKLGRMVEAESAFRHALEARETALGRDHPDTLETVANLGEFELLQGRFSAAEAFYTRVEAHYRELPYHPAHLRSLEGLALVYRSLGRFTESEKAFQVLIQSGSSAPDFRTAASHEGLADLVAAEGRFARAAMEYEEAARTWEAIHAPATNLSRVWKKYAGVMRKLRREKDALTAEHRASEVVVSSTGSH